jgi:hypothetical protein
LVLASALLLAGAWQLGLLPRRAPRTPPTVSGFATLPLPRRDEPLRVRSELFRAACTNPAPVLVYDESDHPGPSEATAFVVILATSVKTPSTIADSLARYYGAESDGYDPSKRGFVATLSRRAVSGLRCEPAVASIEEDATIRDENSPSPR